MWVCDRCIGAPILIWPIWGREWRSSPQYGDFFLLGDGSNMSVLAASCASSCGYGAGGPPSAAYKSAAFALSIGPVQTFQTSVLEEVEPTEPWMREKRTGRRSRVTCELTFTYSIPTSTADAPLVDYDPLSITRSQSYLHALYSYMTLTDL